MKPESCRQIFEKKSTNTKFHENPSSESGVVSCGQTGRQSDMTKLQVFTSTQVFLLDTGFSPRHRFSSSTQVFLLGPGFSPRHRFSSSTQVFLLDTGFFSSTQVFLIDTGFSPRHRFFSSTQVFLLDTGFSPRHSFSSSTQVFLLDTGFSWSPCVYKQMLRCFPKFQVATTCFSCSPPDLTLSVTNFIFCVHVK